MDHNLNLKEHWVNIFQTSLDNIVADWNILFHECQHFYSEMNY